MNKQTFVITFFNYAYEKSVKTHFQSIIYSLYKNKNIDNKIFFVNNKIYTFDNKYMIIMNNNDINIIQNNYKLLIQMISEYFNYIKDDIVDFDNIIFNNLSVNMKEQILVLFLNLSTYNKKGLYKINNDDIINVIDKYKN